MEKTKKFLIDRGWDKDTRSGFNFNGLASILEKFAQVKNNSVEKLTTHNTMFNNLLNDIEKCSRTYKKMYKDGVKTLDTYDYVGIFDSLINRYKLK